MSIQAQSQVGALNPAKAQSFLAIAGNRFATWTGSCTVNPPYCAPASDPAADYFSFLASAKDTGQGTVYDHLQALEPGARVLVDTQLLDQHLEGKNVEISYVITKTPQIAQALVMQSGGILQELPGVGSSAEEKKGIKYTTILGAVAAAAAGALVAGPIGAVVAGAGVGYYLNAKA